MEGNLSIEAEKPLVISFYTENTPYQLEVMHLIESCRKLEIEADIEGVPSQGTWDLNCAIKPFFIQKKLKEKKRPIFWVDADAVFKKAPDFSIMSQADVAVRENKRFSYDPRLRLCSGSMFINYTDSALQFVDLWCNHCSKQIDEKQNLEFLDQRTLVELIEDGFPVKVFPLPTGYAKIFDLDALEVDPEEIVVEHFQASRRYRYWTG